MKTFLRITASFLLLLAGIQLARAAVIFGLWSVLQPGNNSVLWNMMDIAAYGLVGIGLLLVFRPSQQALGLNWGSAARREKWITLAAGALVIILTVSTFWFGPDILAANFTSVFIIPIFEELLFRGWGWGKLDQSLVPGWLRWLTISIIFGIWHFGYADIYLLKVAPIWPEMNWSAFLLMKFLTTLAIGLVVGLPRWRSGRVHGSLILHALVNLFGR